MPQKFSLEFILHVHGPARESIKNALSEFGDHLEITDDTQGSGEARDFRIRMLTEDPTLVFDVCSQFGRIKSVKINEEGRL